MGTSFCWLIPRAMGWGDNTRMSWEALPMLINYIDETTSYPVSFFGQGYGLLCVGYPLSDLEVETQDEDEVCKMIFESSHRITFSGGHIKSCERFCKLPCAELFPWLTGILATIWTILCKGPLGKRTRTNLSHLPIYGHCHVATCCLSSHTVTGSVC